MRRLVLALFLVGCASAARSPAPSQPPAAPVRHAPSPVAPTVEPRPYGTVDLDERDAPLTHTLELVAEAADRPIAASVSTATRVTLALHAAPWGDVLDYLVFQYHLVRRDTGKLIVLTEPPHNHLEAAGASPTSWYLLLARQGGINIIIPGKLPGEIDAELWNVRYEDALRSTAHSNGLEVEPVR